MKKTFLIVLTAGVTLCGGYRSEARDVVPDAPVQVGGVGPVVAGSVSPAQLPSKARRLIDKLGVRVTECEREYASGEYEVKLDLGIGMEFSKDGDIMEIDAPGYGLLGSDFIREMVPERLYSNLRELKLDGAVNSIESKRDGFKVEFSGSLYEEGFFSPKGDLIALSYD